MAGRRRLFHRRHGLLAMGRSSRRQGVDKANFPASNAGSTRCRHAPVCKWEWNCLPTNADRRR